jgi:hypothetical protein
MRHKPDCCDDPLGAVAISDINSGREILYEEIMRVAKLEVGIRKAELIDLTSTVDLTVD